MLNHETTPALAGTAYITASASPSQGGSVSPTSRVCTVGSYLTIYATPASDYEFEGWYTGSLKVAYSSSYTFYVSRSDSYTAKFIKIHTVTVQCDVMTGTVSGGGRIKDGDYTWIGASAHRDYKFEGWYKNGTRLNLDANDKYTPTESCTLTAKFTYIPTYTVTLVSESSIRGSVSAGGSVTQGGTLSISAYPNVGYAFDGWYKNGRLESFFPMLSYTPTESCTLEARFYPTIRYTVTVQSEDINKGTVGGGGTVATRETVHVWAIAKPGYLFEGWYINGSRQNYLKASDAYTVTDSCILVARFVEAYTVTLQSEDVNKGTVIGGGIIAAGTTVQVSAVPILGYKFDGWYYNGSTYRSDMPQNGTFKPTESCMLQARFVKDNSNPISVSWEKRDSSMYVFAQATYPVASRVTILIEYEDDFTCKPKEATITLSQGYQGASIYLNMPQLAENMSIYILSFSPSSDDTYDYSVYCQ